jgi:phosphatidylinositol-3-phosphatase
VKGYVSRPLTALALVLACLSLTGRTASAGGLEGIPGYDHVFVLVLENESFSSTFGPGSPAHYLNNTLVPAGVLDDQYYATGHISLDNYITMTSGVPPTNPNTLSDCLADSLWDCVQSTIPFNPSGASIADELDSVSKSWKGYMDSMPSPCFHQTYAATTQAADPYQGNGAGDATYTGDYADRHNPFNYYTDIVGDAARCQAHVLPFTSLAADIGGGTVPNFAFVTPDTCHDGHDTPTCSNHQPGGLVAADAWLQSNVPPILSYINAHNGLLLITFDEGSTSDLSGCCHGGPGGQAGKGGLVGLVALGPGVKTGQTVHTQYDHASLLRTVEDIFGINTYLNNAAASSPMLDLFGTPRPTVPEGPATAALAVFGIAAAIASVRFGRRLRTRS